MARPLVGSVTERVYATLPELYRDADTTQTGPDYPLLRYLALVLDQLADVDDLLERLDYHDGAALTYGDGQLGDGLYGYHFGSHVPGSVYGDSSLYGDGRYAGVDSAALVDPAVADARWLPWLAQLLGVTIDNLPIADARTALATPETAWDHGTPAAIGEAAAARLTGTQAVEVTPHYDGDPFIIGIGTLDAETVSADTFGKLKALAPRWSDLKTLGSFANAKAPAPILGAQVERPAGYRLAHYATG